MRTFNELMVDTIPLALDSYLELCGASFLGGFEFWELWNDRDWMNQSCEWVPSGTSCRVRDWSVTDAINSERKISNPSSSHSSPTLSNPLFHSYSLVASYHPTLSKPKDQRKLQSLEIWLETVGSCLRKQNCVTRNKKTSTKTRTQNHYHSHHPHT